MADDCRRAYRVDSVRGNIWRTAEQAVIRYAAAVALLTCSGMACARPATLVAGGDVEWSRQIWPSEAGIRLEWTAGPWWIGAAPTLVRRDPQLVKGLARAVTGGRPWPPLPLVYADSADHSRRFGLRLDDPHWRSSLPIDLDGVPPDQVNDYPFAEVVDLLHAADIAFANLEGPVSDRAQLVGGFRMPAAFAAALARASIDVVSTANNHMLDAETAGLTDTLAVLSVAGVKAVGSGSNLGEARRPVIVERHDQRVAFIAYTQESNIVTGFALPARAGVAPLDPDLVIADIRAAAKENDVVVVSVHWGIENTPAVHPSETVLARRFIDAGADLILGHGPHVPRGVESYRGGLIVYSLGNFIFGHGHSYWDDNYLIAVTFDGGRVVAAELHPISGKGVEVGRPTPLKGERAAELLDRLRAQSASWGTDIQTVGSTARVVLTAGSELQ